jgi:hypothetical protein
MKKYGKTTGREDPQNSGLASVHEALVIQISSIGSLGKEES